MTDEMRFVEMRHNTTRGFALANSEARFLFAQYDALAARVALLEAVYNAVEMHKCNFVDTCDHCAAIKNALAAVAAQEGKGCAECGRDRTHSQGCPSTFHGGPGE